MRFSFCAILCLPPNEHNSPNAGCEVAWKKRRANAFSNNKLHLNAFRVHSKNEVEKKIK